MAIPDVTLTIRDGALGLAQAPGSNTALKIGPAPLGIVNSIISVNDLAGLQAACGKSGPLVESAALSLAVAGGPLYLVPVNPSTYGTASAVTKVAPAGSPTVTVAVKNAMAVTLKCTLGGATATAKLALSLDGGATYGAEFVTAATVQVPGCSFLTIACGGTTFNAGDLFAISTAGVVTFTGGGTGTVTVSSASPLDAYAVTLTVVLGGALGTATFTYSLDGGNTVSPVILVPASGTYVLPDTGIVVTFPSGTYVAGDYYTFTTTTASYTGTDFTNAMTAVLADPRTWFMVHVVGAAASVGAAATLLATVDTQLGTAANAFRFACGLIEVPTDTDANILAAFNAASTVRVGAAAGYVYVTSPLTGRVMSRNAAWIVAARLAKNAPSQDAAAVADGPVSNVPASLTTGAKVLVRDEAATQALDAARFCTLRSIVGRAGVFVTNARLMAPANPASDYSYIVNRRVMDIACTVARQAGLQYLNASVRVDADGTINEKDAANIEAYIDASLRAALTNPGYASDVSVVVNRLANILSTGILPITLRITPLGYARTITEDIGFSNPNLVPKQ